MKIKAVIFSAILFSLTLAPAANGERFAREPGCFYQLALVTPGIKPSEAISRKVMRERPNFR